MGRSTHTHLASPVPNANTGSASSAIVGCSGVCRSKRRKRLRGKTTMRHFSFRRKRSNLGNAQMNNNYINEYILFRHSRTVRKIELHTWYIVLCCMCQLHVVLHVYYTLSNSPRITGVPSTVVSNVVLPVNVQSMVYGVLVLLLQYNVQCTPVKHLYYSTVAEWIPM